MAVGPASCQKGLPGRFSAKLFRTEAASLLAVPVQSNIEATGTDSIATISHEWAVQTDDFDGRLYSGVRL